jgi:hypothetical protein
VFHLSANLTCGCQKHPKSLTIKPRTNQPTNKWHIARVVKVHVKTPVIGMPPPPCRARATSVSRTPLSSHLPSARFDVIRDGDSRAWQGPWPSHGGRFCKKKPHQYVYLTCNLPKITYMPSCNNLCNWLPLY